MYNVTHSFLIDYFNIKKYMKIMEQYLYVNM